jgi:hypothetical protein
MVFRQIIRDAEIAYAISPVVRRHRLTEEETKKFLLELRIPRAANVAGITHRLVVFQKSQLADKLLTEGELRTRGPELIWKNRAFGQRSPVTRVCSLNSTYESRTVLNFTTQQNGLNLKLVLDSRFGERKDRKNASQRGIV